MSTALTRTAAEELALALVDMAARRQRPRCAEDPEVWFSVLVDERARAARLCNGCEVLSLCGAAADEAGERWGVWAGVDRTQATTRRAAPATARTA